MSLIDCFLPRYQFSERHAVTIAADPRRVMELVVLRDILADDPIVRTMMALRAAPSALWQKFRPARQPTMTGFGRHSFTPLGYDAQEIVSGLVGRFWQPSGGLRQIADANAFLAFDEMGTPKLAMNFLFLPQSSGTRLVTETRVFCPDLRSRILLTPYWLAIRLGSGFIRKRYLRAVKRLAENWTE